MTFREEEIWKTVMFDVCQKRNLVRKIHVKSCHKQLRKLQQRNVFEKISLFEFSRIFKKIRSSRIFTIRTVTNILILSLSFSIVSLDDETRMNNTIWHLKFLSFKKLRLCGNLCFTYIKKCGPVYRPFNGRNTNSDSLKIC